MSWKPEVIADRSGEWNGNTARFATKVEAEQYVADLAYRWTLASEIEVGGRKPPPSLIRLSGAAVRRCQSVRHRLCPHRQLFSFPQSWRTALPAPSGAHGPQG